MDKNFIIAIILMMVVTFVWFTYVSPPPDQHNLKKTIDDSKNQEVSQSEPKEKINQNILDKNLQGYEEEEFFFENENYEVIFSSIGASIKSLKLKKYNERIEYKSPIEMINILDNIRYPSQVKFEENNFGYPEISCYNLLETSDNSLTFIWNGENDIQVKKKYRFRDDYHTELIVEIINNSENVISGIPTLSFTANLRQEITPSGFSCQGGCGGSGSTYGNIPVLFANKRLIQEKTDRIKKASALYNASQNIWWSGFDRHYFLSAVIPSKSLENINLSIKHLGLEIYEELLKSSKIEVSPKEKYEYFYLLYFGPKDLDYLKVSGRHLERILSYGWTGDLSVIFLTILKKLYSLVGNYGVAIIILTIIVRIVLYPLTLKSYKSMRKMSEDMKRIQPELERIKKKYYDIDKEKYQQEVMAAYKRNNINPLGCMGSMFPTLLQIPVFIGLYSALANSVELRHAPFIWWIKDLSAMDPYYITPILMGITMYITQKMTPTTAVDPNQAKMMTLMPIIFTLMLFSLPSGLMLYWLVSNIVSIGQQYIMQKTVKI